MISQQLSSSFAEIVIRDALNLKVQCVGRASSRVCVVTYRPRVTQMTVSNDVKKRLLYTKFLLSRARGALSERNELALAVALLLMHDAAEMLMLAVADHLQVPMPKKWDFMDFWTEIKKCHPEPPQRLAMESMNKMRVALKHNGVLPHGQTVRDFLPRMQAFCEDVANAYLNGLKFSEISLVDLVDNADVRGLLAESRIAFTNGDKEEAFIKLKVAFDTLDRQLPKEVPLIQDLPYTPFAVPNEIRRFTEPYRKTSAANDQGRQYADARYRPHQIPVLCSTVTWNLLDDGRQLPSSNMAPVRRRFSRGF